MTVRDLSVEQLIDNIKDNLPGWNLTNIDVALGLKIGTLKKWRQANRAPADAVALLRVTCMFPWLVKVSADRFSPVAVKEHLLRAGTEALIEKIKEDDSEKKSRAAQAMSFFKAIKNKIEKDNPGVGVHIGTIKLPKGSGKELHRKIIQGLAKKLDAKPTRIMRFDPKRKEEVIRNMTAWAKNQQAAQVRNDMEHRLKAITVELKKNKLLQQQFHALTPVFFSLARLLYSYRKGIIDRRAYLKGVKGFEDFMLSRTR